MKIINKYESDGMSVTEYTKDGTTVSHTVKTPMQTESIEPQEPEPTNKELKENQVAIMNGLIDLYMTNLGG